MSDFRFYMSLVSRRLPFLSVIVFVCALAAVFVALALPKEFRAGARLVVEPAQIPGDLASSTVQASAVEILELIRQRILARGYLLELSERFGVHSDKPNMTSDDIVEDMRERIHIDIPLFSPGNRAIFVPVSFSAPNGEMSAQVVEALVEKILQENTALRTSVAGQTLAFFEQEVERLNFELGEQGDTILEFKELNRDALPDSLDYRRTRQSSLQERILQQERELSGLRDRRSRLVEIYERTGRPDILGESLTPEQRQLRQLQDQLASALVIYSSENPRIKSLKAQIAALEAANIRLGLGTEAAPNITAFELQLSDVDGQIEFLEEERTATIAELDTLNDSIDATPTNALRLGTLEREYDNLRLQYAEAASSLAEARTGNQIEAQSRGQRISVVEPATVPTMPSSPNRKLIVAAGLAAGFGLAIGVFLLLEFFNNTIRRTSDITSQMNIPVIGTVPYMETGMQTAMRRGRIYLMFGAMLLVGFGGLYLIHIYYLPLDIFVEDTAAKFGIGGMFGNTEAG